MYASDMYLTLQVKDESRMKSRTRWVSFLYGLPATLIVREVEESPQGYLRMLMPG